MADLEFPRRGAPTPEFGTKTYYFKRFLCWKLHENERNWSERSVPGTCLGFTNDSEEDPVSCKRGHQILSVAKIIYFLYNPMNSDKICISSGDFSRTIQKSSLHQQLLQFWNFTRTWTQVPFSYPDLVLYQTICNTKWLIFAISCKKSHSHWTEFTYFESHALGMKTTL